MSSEIILAVDTSTATTDVALCELADGRSRLVGHSAQPVQARSDGLLPLIAEVLTQAQLDYSMLTALAVGMGPGSFTGLRIGMACCKGIAYAAQKPLWACSSLAALAWHASAQPGEYVLATIDAKRSEVYAGIFMRERATVRSVCAEYVASPARVLEHAQQLAGTMRLHFAGDGHLAFPGIFPSEASPVTPPAQAIAELAAMSREDHLIFGTPTYIRPSEVEIKFPDGNTGGTFSPA